MEVIDALSGDTDAKSVVQLNSNPVFKRGNGSIRGAICNFAADLE